MEIFQWPDWFLSTAHETTELALTDTWFLLGHHPDPQTRLHDKLDDVLGNELPTAADLPKLEYTNWVVEEEIQLYPPVWTIFRKPVEDVEDRSGDRPEYAHYLFRGGPRHCIGMRFARMEARLTMSTLAREFAVESVTETPIDMTASANVLPAEPVEVRLSQRRSHVR